MQLGKLKSFCFGLELFCGVFVVVFLGFLKFDFLHMHAKYPLVFSTRLDIE